MGETSCPVYRHRGLSVSRAYISPEKPRHEANLRVLPRFLLVFWNLAKDRTGGFTRCCGYVQEQRYSVDTLCGMRFVMSAPVTEVLGTVRRYYICRSNRCFDGPFLIKQRRRLPQSRRRQVLAILSLCGGASRGCGGRFLDGSGRLNCCYG